MQFLSIKQIHKQLMSRERSSQEITKSFLDAIGEKDKEIHAFLSVSEEGAMRQAEKIDQKIAKGEAIGELAGIPFGIKDNIVLMGFRCTAASKILENYEAPYDATVVKKLKDAGAVILGKTNLDEFAMGSSTENSAYGATKNPHDLERVPGGSSGGSAAAVAAEMCVAALGSDTGGSIRQPAAFCGVVGFRATYGAVSRYGLIAMASSLDVIGPLARCVEDARIIFDAIRGKDTFDATSIEIKNEKLKTKNVRIGIPKEYFGEGIDKDVKKSVEGAIKKYEENGAKIQEISLPHAEYGLAVYYILMPSEVSANLARYDGIRYGAHEEADSLVETYRKTREKCFGNEVRRRIMLGTYTLSSGYYDAYYVRAEKVRMLIKQDFDNAFRLVDVIMTPVTPTVPFRFGEKSKDPVSMYLSDMFTVGANIAGLPAISIPCGWTLKEGKKLPVGLQIIGGEGRDYDVISIAQMFEIFQKSS
ncbi:MAG: Asp-tRNA(Asn)/Glu-tRNA(Gln) amidotransferase subunit GatA [Candidatus Spechtbacteria bacterium]|nr:Asp-tRNA(Asn)/Glu-tRNA(Gln) amidotransferase subunit GatA [Candidatus Spechtbacteria bacterium]